MGSDLKIKKVSGSERRRLIGQWSQRRDECESVYENNSSATTCGRANRRIAWDSLSYAEKQLDSLDNGIVEYYADYCDMCGRERDVARIENTEWEVCSRCAKIFKVFGFITGLFFRRR